MPAIVAPARDPLQDERGERRTRARNSELLVLLFACLVFLPSLLRTPRLMDDEDAARAQISRNMIRSGDWITPRLNGIRYFEKPPLMYWMVAASMSVFGESETAVRIPTVLISILLCWLVTRMAREKLGDRAGLYAGLSLSTCAGMWLFTRILIPDIALTFAVTAAVYAFRRSLERVRSRWWAAAWIAVAAGLLLKGLIAVVFTLGPIALYLAVTGLWRERETRRRLAPLKGLALMTGITAPWYILATLRNPPFLDFSMRSTPGIYRGFFWYHLFNEQILRFMGRRYPHDFSNIALPWFWLLHLAWLFPWSVFLLRAVRLRYRAADPASRMRLMALCWVAVIIGFLALVPTQEYYSMPAYPALAILIGSAMAECGDRAWVWSIRTAGAFAATAFIALAWCLWVCRGIPAPGDIAQALTRHDGAYTVSLGHMRDLTVHSLAYLRAPLAIAAAAALLGAVGAFAQGTRRTALPMALAMAVFFQAARVALIAFDPYLGSYRIAMSLSSAPAGGLIVDDPYYEFSSLFYYADRTALLLNGRANNLEYGSYAADAPRVFIGDADFVARWQSPDRWYVASEDEKAEHLRRLVGTNALHPVVGAGGKTLYVNR